MVNVNFIKRKHLISALFWYYFYEHIMNIELIGAVLFLSLYIYSKESARTFEPCVGSWLNDGKK